MENKLLKVITVIASGVVTYKAISALRYYKLQKDIYEEIENDTTDEK